MVSARDYLVVLLLAAFAALAWTWFLTWAIARWGSYPEDEERD